MANRHPHPVAKLAVALLVAVLIAATPTRASAGPAEDALKECINGCFGIGVCILACSAGYVIFGNSDGTADSVPRFNHLGSRSHPPLGPFGNELIDFEPGDIVTLQSGRWTGCPPDCLDPGRFLAGPGPVSRTLFWVVANEDLFAAADYDSAPWMALGEGRFDRRTDFWTLRWDTAGFTERAGYSLRVDFMSEARGGEVLLGHGVTVALRRAVIVGQPRRRPAPPVFPGQLKPPALPHRPR